MNAVVLWEALNCIKPPTFAPMRTPASRKAIKATYLSIVGNSLLAVVKFLTGFFGNSYALIADAIESTSDIFASTLVLVGLRYASRPPDENHPYGHGKAEPLITFAVVGFLVISATLIAVQSIENIREPHEVPEPYTLIVLAAIILVKEIFYRVMKQKAKETGSSSLVADAWHHRSDAITSLAAFLGISFALWQDYPQADDWAALVAVAIILYNAFRIFRPALSEVMDEHRYDELVDRIRLAAAEVQGVITTEKCFVRKMGMTFQVDLHAIVKAEISVREGHQVAHELKDHLLEQITEIADVHIHIEPDDPEIMP